MRGKLVVVGQERFSAFSATSWGLSLPSNHQSANGAVLYQRGAKPHDKGHLDIIFHNSRAESPDYPGNVFVCLVYFVVDAMFIQPTRTELSLERIFGPRGLVRR